MNPVYIPIDTQETDPLIMRYTLRSLLRRWKIRFAYLLQGNQPASRASDEAVRPQLVALENRTVPAGMSNLLATFNASGNTVPSNVIDVSRTNSGLSVSNVPASATLTFQASSNAGVVTVTSRVFADANRNGVAEATESGIANAQVKLFDSFGTLLGTAVSDANGNFSFTSASGRSTANSVFNAPLQSGAIYQLRVQSSAAPVIGLTVQQQTGGTVSAYSRGPSSATIGGSVFTDTNGNGRFDGGEPNVGGVTINLLDDSNSQVLQTTTSAGDGTYSFVSVPAGTYRVEFVSSSLPAGNVFTTRFAVGSTANNDSDADPVTGQSGPITVASGDFINNIGAGIYVPVVLGDFVFADANNNGIQDKGEGGQANVVVNLLDGSGNLVQTQTTAGNGLYLFSAAPGSYQIEFVAPAGMSISAKGQGGNATLDSDADPVSGRTSLMTFVSDDFNVDLDAGITSAVAPTGSIGDFVFFDGNANGIQDAGEFGLPNMKVNLLDGKGNFITSTSPDSFGKYQFTGLAAGSYIVEFVPTANFFTLTAQGQGADPKADSDADPNTGRTAVITLAAGEQNNDIDAGLFKPSSAIIGDFVFLDTNNNGVQDAGEGGVSNVTVNLLDSNGKFLSTTSTDINGRYQFANVAPGSYQVEFVAPAGFNFGKQDQGGDDNVDSDADTNTGRTVVFTVAAGQGDMSRDAALVAQPPALSSLGDFVFFDANLNGIQDPGDFGVPNQVVNLLDGNGNFVATTKTDSNGKYFFTNLTAGKYIIEVATTPAGWFFSNANQGGDPKLDSDIITSNNGTGRTAVITLAAGVANLDVDAGLTKPSSALLGDFVWNDLNCDGIQQPNEPGVANVTVMVLDTNGNVIATTKTDNNGKYLVNGLAPGSYQVMFTLPNGFVFTSANKGADDTVDSDADANGKTQFVTLQAGQADMTLDAGLCAVAAIGDFVWLDKNFNGVQDAGEAGVQGVNVMLLDANGNMVSQQSTDASGKYLFSDLAPGTYSVKFTAPAGFTVTRQDQGGNDIVDSDADQVTGKTGSYTLAPGETNLTVDAGIYQKAQLGDFVFLDTNKNGVQDAGEAGVANVTVALFDANGNTVGTQKTDSNGKYLFTNLDPGSYSVQFTAPAGFTITGQDQGGDDAADSDADQVTGKTGSYTLQSGDSNLTVDAGLVQQKAALGDFVFLDTNKNGVQDAGEAGVPNVTVTLFDSKGNVVGTQKTDGSGKYLFTNLDAGSYSVQFTAPAGFTITSKDQGGNDATDSDADQITGKTASVTLSAGETNLTVDAGLVANPAKFKLGDFVWQDTNGNGIQDANEPGVANVIVMLLDGTGNVLATTKTDANGGYQFTNLDAGTYNVMFTAPAGFSFTSSNAGANDAVDSDANPLNGKTGNFSLTSDDLTRDAGLVSAPLPSSIAGKVYHDKNNNGIVDPGENGIAGAKITLTGVDNQGNTVNRVVFTGPDGTYVFTGLRPGTYKVNETQPPNFIDGKDTAGSVGGDVTNDMIANIQIAAGVDAVNYNFGERINGNGNGGKDELLASSGGITPTLAQQAGAMPTSPTFGNAVASSRLSDPNTRRYIVTSGDAGSAPVVRVFDYGSGANRFTINAYDAAFRGGVRTAVGDVTGDGIPDIVTAPGAGGGPHIKVFDGATGALVAQFMAYSTSFTGGVYLAVGDVDGNGTAEIITGAGEGGGAHVRVFTAAGSVVREFFAFDPAFRGGVRVAAGDVNGDGKADIVTAAGPGGGPHVRVYSGMAAQGILSEVFAYGASFRGGVYVAAGDVNGDGKADVITGAGAGGGPHVRVLSGVGLTQLASFYAYPSNFSGGVRVGALDVDGDGRADVLTSPGAGLPSFTRIIDINRGGDLENFLSNDPTAVGGAFVSGGR